MRFLIYFMMMIFIVGCATTSHRSRNDNYTAKTIAPTRVPPDLSTSNFQNYYPIPPAANAQARPSLLPPGSLLPGQQQAQAASSVARGAMVAQSQNVTSPVMSGSASSLTLNLNYDQAWIRVGRALRSGGYKVLQQDSSLGNYYVLDTASTGGTLKANTPIYQVHLSRGGNTVTVSVFNDKNQMANPAVSGRILGAVRRGV